MRESDTSTNLCTIQGDKLTPEESISVPRFRQVLKKYNVRTFSEENAFNDIEYSMSPSTDDSKSSNLWTPDEDRKLMLSCEGSEQKDWPQIAKSVPGRTSKQCWHRFHYYLKNHFRTGDWTEEEDAIILQQQAIIGNRWSQIARLLSGRSENSVKNRWHCSLRHRSNCRPFDLISNYAETASMGPERETSNSNTLLDLHTSGASNYKFHVSEICSFDSKEKHESSLEKEDQARTGIDHALASTLLYGNWSRGPVNPWTPVEDQALLKALSGNKQKDWSAIAKSIPGRSRKQCWHRFHYHLKDRFRAGDWTPEEDATILQQQAVIGNRWSLIASLLPGRSENSVKNRWHCSLRHRRPAPGGGDDGEPRGLDGRPTTRKRGRERSLDTPPISPSDDYDATDARTPRSGRCTFEDLLAAAVGSGCEAAPADGSVTDQAGRHCRRARASSGSPEPESQAAEALCAKAGPAEAAAAAAAESRSLPLCETSGRTRRPSVCALQCGTPPSPGRHARHRAMLLGLLGRPGRREASAFSPYVKPRGAERPPQGLRRAPLG